MGPCEMDLCIKGPPKAESQFESKNAFAEIAEEDEEDAKRISTIGKRIEIITMRLINAFQNYISSETPCASI